MGTIRENIDAINKNKDEIAAKVGRKPGEVLLVAVTKTRSAEEINEPSMRGLQISEKTRSRRSWKSMTL
jgi:uncharacterized pyridoxal phosphate-containing UPF0001 family protein